MLKDWYFCVGYVLSCVTLQYTLESYFNFIIVHFYPMESYCNIVFIDTNKLSSVGEEVCRDEQSVYIRTWGILVESVSTCPSTCTGSTKVTVTPQCSDDVLYTTQCHMYVYVHITLCDYKYTRTSTARLLCVMSQYLVEKKMIDAAEQ